MLIIEIDCAPGCARPDAFIGEVVAMFNLKVNSPVSKSFGSWIWHFEDVSEKEFDDNYLAIQAYFETLYMQGEIRAASFQYV